jgi:ubiquinone/menaquinone biosynthesis C-methylase UbiE
MGSDHADQATVDYFNKMTTHYDVGVNLSKALEFLKAAPADSKLVDVGCGDGATLEYIRDNMPINNLYGMDVAENYLQEAQQKTDCATVHGSVLDDNLINEYAEQFDYAVLRSVLHHLVGRDRKASKANARLCINNTLRILKPGGTLLIAEQTYSPHLLNFFTFWIKKTVGSVTNDRLSLGPEWLNIAQPVVSYYTPAQVIAYAGQSELSQIESTRIFNSRKLALVIAPSLTFVTIERSAS